ncbi:MAG TPA: hypothetical protein VGX23_02190 [Actinocrinis sp.]|nr:hypothetical protein [Actinocrinis sp.]
MYSPQKSAGARPGRTGARPLWAGAFAVAALVGLAGCASASSSADGSNAAGTPSGSSGSGGAVASASATAGPTAAPTGPAGSTSPAASQGGAIASPQAQAAKVPAGATLVAFQGVSKSSDGMTVYVSAAAGGGVCGQYDVVVQETSGTVSIGLAHIPPAKAVPCPLFLRVTAFPAHLTTPVGNRQVIDLADNSSVGDGNGLPVFGSGSAKLPQ